MFNTHWPIVIQRSSLAEGYATTLFTNPLDLNSWWGYATFTAVYSRCVYISIGYSQKNFWRKLYSRGSVRVSEYLHLISAWNCALSNLSSSRDGTCECKQLNGWRQSYQQDATKLMYIIKFLSQNVSDIIMPIICRTSVCTAACGVLHWVFWLWLCGTGTWAVCTV